MARNVTEYSLHRSFGYRLTLLSRINERAFERRISPLQVTRVMWCVLLAVDSEGLQRPSQIASFVGIDRTATSRALRQMTQRGLIERRADIKDGRSRTVSTTRKGRRVLSEATAQARVSTGWFSDKLNHQELLQLDRLIDKLLAGETRAVPHL